MKKSFLFFNVCFVLMNLFLSYTLITGVMTHGHWEVATVLGIIQVINIAFYSNIERIAR